MFKQLEKKKASQNTTESKKIGETCPKCQYTRNDNELAPEWQCPNCQIAYNKFYLVTDKFKGTFSSTVKKFNYITIKEKIKSLENKAWMLSLPGIFTFINGLPSESCKCNGVAQATKLANPILLLIGGILTILAAAYYVKNRIRIKNEQNE